MPESSIRKLSSARAASRAKRLVEAFMASEEPPRVPSGQVVLSATPSVRKTERRGKIARYWSVHVRCAGVDGGPIYLVDIEAGLVRIDLVGL